MLIFSYELLLYILFNIIVFFMGATFGSFYTLARYRIPKKMDIVKKGSFCPSCKSNLTFWDQIPVFSYLFLKGRCSHCKTKIPLKYFWTELNTGIAFVLMFNSVNLFVGGSLMQKVLLLLSFPLVYTFIYLTTYLLKKESYISYGLLAYGVIVVGTFAVLQYILAQSISYFAMQVHVIEMCLLILISVSGLWSQKAVGYHRNILSSLIILAIYVGLVNLTNGILLATTLFLIFLLIFLVRNTSKEYDIDKLPKAKEATVDGKVIVGKFKNSLTSWIYSNYISLIMYVSFWIFIFNLYAKYWNW